jgi:hypothetical protein
MKKRIWRTLVWLSLMSWLGQLRTYAQHVTPPPSFEIYARRMDVDVDGAPNAYGPTGTHPLDYLKNARLEGHFWAPIVGFVMYDGKPVLQGPRDPAPGYYISTTAYTDKDRTEERDVLRYVDATKINYIVLGKAAKRKGARLGDFVAVYSTRTRQSAFGIVADDGNPSGDEGSLHLLQALGYAFHDGKDDAVEKRNEILIRFYPGSNPAQMFFRRQRDLNNAAMKLGLSRDFSPAAASKP